MTVILIILGLIFFAFSLRFTWWWCPLQKGFTVFMYHNIRPDAERTPDESIAFSVTPEAFEKQVKYLLSKGYTFIGLEEMENSFQKQVKFPPKPVMITFDDGYLNNYKYVFPILKKYNIKAVIFLIAAQIGTNPNLMTWEQVLEMQKSGLVSFGSHGLNHKNIRRTEEALALQELKESKTI